MSSIEGAPKTIGEFAYGMSLTLTDRNLASPFRIVRTGYIVPASDVDRETNFDVFYIRDTAKLIDEKMSPEFNFLGLVGQVLTASRIGRRVMALRGYDEETIDKKASWSRKYLEVNKQKRKNPGDFVVYKRKPTLFIPKVGLKDLLGK